MIDVRYQYGGQGYSETTYIIETTDLDEAIKQLQEMKRKEKYSKVNKLAKHLYGDRMYEFTDETLDTVIKEKRASGKTTAQALEQIAEAIKTPGKAVKLVSDHGEESVHVRMGYGQAVKGIIDKLDLKFMVIREHNQTLTFEI